MDDRTTVERLAGTAVVRVRGDIVIPTARAFASTGEVLWSRDFDESEPMPTRSPEGLARAISICLDRVVRDVAPKAKELASAIDTKRPATRDWRLATP